MNDFVTDTHPLIWHLIGDKRLSPVARQLFVDDVARTMLQQVPWSAIPELADRMIAATAIALNLPLITKDHKITGAHVVRTIW